MLSAGKTGFFHPVSLLRVQAQTGPWGPHWLRCSGWHLCSHRPTGKRRAHTHTEWALVLPKHSCLRAVSLQQHLPKTLLRGRIRPLREVTTSTGAVSIRLPKKIRLGHIILLYLLRSRYMQSVLPILVVAFLLSASLSIYPSIILNNLQQFFRKRNIGLRYFFKFTCVPLLHY